MQWKPQHINGKGDVCKRLPWLCQGCQRIQKPFDPPPPYAWPFDMESQSRSNQRSAEILAVPGLIFAGLCCKWRDNNLITYSACWRQDCCQSQLPTLPIPVLPYPPAGTHEGKQKQAGLHSAVATEISFLRGWPSFQVLSGSTISPRPSHFSSLHHADHDMVFSFWHIAVQRVLLQLMEKSKHSILPKTAPHLENEMCSRS